MSLNSKAHHAKAHSPCKLKLEKLRHTPCNSCKDTAYYLNIMQTQGDKPKTPCKLHAKTRLDPFISTQGHIHHAKTHSPCKSSLTMQALSAKTFTTCKLHLTFHTCFTLSIFMQASTSTFHTCFTLYIFMQELFTKQKTTSNTMVKETLKSQMEDPPNPKWFKLSVLNKEHKQRSRTPRKNKTKHVETH